MAIPATAIQYCRRFLANIIRQKNEIRNYAHTHIYIENKEVLFIGDMIVLSEESTTTKLWAPKAKYSKYTG